MSSTPGIIGEAGRPPFAASGRHGIRRLPQAAALLAAAACPAGILALGGSMFAALLGASAAANAALALALLGRQRALRTARLGEQSFRDLYDSISEGVFRSTLDGRMISANPSLVRLNGYETEADFIRGVNDIAREWYVEPGRRDEIHRMLLQSGQVTCVSEVYRHRTRERIWIEENTRLVLDKRTGAPAYYDGTVREVTETVRRLELQDRYNKIASIMSGCLYQHRLRPDGSATMPYASIGLLHLFGIDPEAVAKDASVLAAVIHPEDLPHIAASLQQSSQRLTDWQCEYRICRKDSETRWVLAHAMPEREADGSTLWHGYIMDVSERRRSESKIHRLAFYDALTGLPNRTMLRQSLRQAMAASGAGDRWGALLFIDLDHFKILNDSKGHHVGDLLLREIASRLVGCTLDNDVVARLGGDEFVVLLQDLDGDGQEARRKVQAIGEEILRAVEQPFEVESQPFQIEASMGAALFRGSGDGEEILKQADLAMYAAKSAGRGTLCFFEPAMQEAIEDRLALSSDLRQALAEGGLSLAYQAQVDGSGLCFGAEALLRWRHPVRGDIPPSDIIPLAERNGLINPLEEWVLRTACATLKSWERDPALGRLQLAVNVTAHQLNRAGFVASLREALDETGANPHRLSLELTEHVMLDNSDDVTAVMLELKELGISFALDDFGTGYSSLTYLKRLPIDALKIDRSFVRDIETDPSDREIVQTIVNIAHSLQIAIIAEGVETPMQALLLRQLGCHAYQGYLFGRPMPLSDFADRHALDRASGERHSAQASIAS